MRFVCKKNFLDGKNEKGKLISYKIGDEYKGERGEEFLAKGMVADADQLDAKSAEDLEALIAKKQEELSGLMERLKALQEKLPAKEQPPSEKIGDSEQPEAGEEAAAEGHKKKKGKH